MNAIQNPRKSSGMQLNMTDDILEPAVEETAEAASTEQIRDAHDPKWRLKDETHKAYNATSPSKGVGGIQSQAKRRRGRPKRTVDNHEDDKPPDQSMDPFESTTDETNKLMRTLRIRKQGVGRLRKKNEKETHKFLKRKLKEAKEQAADVPYKDAAEEHTVEEFLEASEDFDKFWENDDAASTYVHQYLRAVKSGEMDKILDAIRPKNATTTDVIDRCLRHMEIEEGCGYRYPVAGSPDERYSDPNVYRQWGRTGLHQAQYLKQASKTFGKVEQRKETLEEMILSTSPLKDDMQVKKQLDSLRIKKLESEIEGLAAPNVNGVADQTGKPEELVCVPTFTAKIDTGGNIIDKQFMSSDRQRQLEMLLALNPYNPWDEYKRMKTIKTKTETSKPIPVTYKLNSFKINMNIEEEQHGDNENRPDQLGCYGTGTHNQMDSDRSNTESCRTMKTTINKTSDAANALPKYFIRDYLHYFMMLPDDYTMMQEFEKAEYLHDVLKYFDTIKREMPEPEPEFVDVQDRLFAILFPGCDGFPKQPADPAFPMTLTPDKTVTNYRVNAISAIVALLRVQKLVQGYAADIFAEQRVKAILQTLERVLELEIERLKLGVSDISVQEVDAKLCDINDAYIATLSATLSLWNLTDGIESLVDAMIVLTLARMQEMRPKYLVAIMVNLANIHKLPKSVFQKFVNSVTQHIHRQMARDLVKLAVDPKQPRWMEFETAAQTLNVMARYKGALSRSFMEAFMQLYEQDFMKLEVPEDTEVAETYDAKMDTEEVTESEDWVSVRKPYNNLAAQRQAEEDTWRHKLKHDMNVGAMKGRVMQYIWSLVSCLSWCDLCAKYRNVIVKLNMTSHLKDLNMHSMGALTVLETCSQKTEDERCLVKRAIITLMDIRMTLKDEQWLEIMRAYEMATLPKHANDTPRIKPDRVFLRSMMNHFIFHRRPKPQVLHEAIEMLKRYVPYLTKEQRDEMFRQMSENVCEYSCVQRQSLNAERLEYPIGEMAHVLRISAECGTRIDKSWKTFIEIVQTFKHVLSLEDIREILAALKAANYKALDDICDMLMTRACDVVEVSPEPDAEIICDIMDLTLALDLPPTKLLRWFLYLHLFHIPESDMDRLSLDLVRGRPQYEIDFRGWKRPVGHIVKDERLEFYRNMYIPLRMDGTKPAIPSDKLKYVMQQHTPEPPPYSGKIRPKEDAKLPKHILERIIRVVKKMISAGHEISEADAKLFKLARVMPPDSTEKDNEEQWSNCSNIVEGSQKSDDSSDVI
ncbi:hypothetical protein X943_001890 [Babesia divergens]|uniref:Uncharacterized protein n=1 Tax=Babesia divergens TaxID=32595 RepID=A0AAD9G732_BABDI|nr:hypothetical protein X943_001890 [Babesia divergens]